MSSTAVIIIFFTCFYTAVVLNPNDLAEKHAKIRRLRPRHPTGTQDGRVHRSGAVAHHASRRVLPRRDRRAVPDIIITQLGHAVPRLRRDQRAHRRRPWRSTRCGRSSRICSCVTTEGFVKRGGSVASSRECGGAGRAVGTPGGQQGNAGAPSRYRAGLGADLHRGDVAGRGRAPDAARARRPVG